MKRFLFWTGGSYINASCRECDFRFQFDSGTPGEVIEQATETHDCMRDGD